MDGPNKEGEKIQIFEGFEGFGYSPLSKEIKTTVLKEVYSV
jgi:hypothetical protein